MPALLDKHLTQDFKLLSKRDVASILGCTVRTIDRLVGSKKIPFTYIPAASGGGRKLKFIDREIAAWVMRDAHVVNNNKEDN